MGKTMGRAISLYRRTPLHPRATRHLAKGLAAYQQLRGVRDEIVQTPRFRVRCSPGDFIEAKLLYTGEYEPATVRALECLVQPGDVCLDVGANVGIITMTLASLVGPAGQVHAIEASDWAYERLQANLALNTFPQVTTTRAAAGPVALEGAEMMLPRGYRLDGKFTAAAQTPRQITLDEYVAEHQIDRVALLKTDTDGREPGVLAGAHALLERDHPVILFEMHPRWLRELGSDPGELLELIRGYGYDFYSEALERVDDPLAAAEAIPEGQSLNLVAQPPM